MTEEIQSNTNEIEEVVLTKKRFTKMIEEKIIANPGITYMDAVLEICEERMIDPLDVNRLISSVVKEKIEAEAMRENLIKGGGNTLPI